MEHRMREFSLTEQETQALLANSQWGVLATVDQEGAPYAVPVYYMIVEGRVYFHGLPRGEKLSNIRRDDRVCLTVAEHVGVMDQAESPCDADAAYRCVVVRGRAHLVEDAAEKRRALEQVIQKYTPLLMGRELTEARVQGTAVVCIQPEEITGKYHR